MAEYIGLFSGGKDSLVACHKMWKDGKRLKCPKCAGGDKNEK